MAEKVIMLGNEAIARGAYEAGVKVSSAYPGTPSTEISEYLVQYKDCLLYTSTFAPQFSQNLVPGFNSAPHCVHVAIVSASFTR